MSQSEQKIVQYLNEAHATEIGLTRVLQSQIAMTPRGATAPGSRSTCARRARTPSACSAAGRARRRRQPARRRARRSWRASLSQTLALWKTPLDLLRGSSGEEKVLKNAKDACATEALEIATYTALEHLARAVGDDKTAKLAASIRADEERMLERVMRELPKLTAAVVGAEIDGNPSYDVTRPARPTPSARRPRRPSARAQRDATPSARRARPARCRASRAPRARSRAPWPPRRTWRSPATTS